MSCPPAAARSCTRVIVRSTDGTQSMQIRTAYPRRFAVSKCAASVFPDRVVSIANEARRVISSTMISMAMRPAAMCRSDSGTCASSRAIASGSTIIAQSGTSLRYHFAKVDLPAPFGPAMMMIKGVFTPPSCIIDCET